MAKVIGCDIREAVKKEFEAAGHTASAHAYEFLLDFLQTDNLFNSVLAYVPKKFPETL